MFKHLFMLNVVISLMHRICLFWINIFAFAIFEIAFFLCQLPINNSKHLEGGWRKRYHDLYSMLLNRPCWWGTGIVSIPKHWSYKEDNPSSTPFAPKKSEFFFSKIKTLNHNLGQGCLLSWSKCITNGTKGVLTKQKTIIVQNNQKDRQSLSKKS